MAKAGKTHRTRAQHYEPQLYLRGFTNTSGKLFCYDKVSDRPYPTSTQGAAQESNFYEIAPGTTVERVADNAVEKQLGKLEAEFGPRLADLIGSADAGKITNEQLAYFSPFVALQWMRTKTFRVTAHEMIEKVGQTHADDLISLNFPGQDPKVNVTYPEKGMPAVHAEKMLDPEWILHMARGLDRHIWVIGITDAPLYTSDHPVVRRANQHDGVRPLVGVRDPGVEFAFPLDSRHLLLILERTHFKDWRKHDAGTVRLTGDQVRDYNCLQVRRSCQRVFCAEDDFTLAREICAAEPEIKNPHRPRVRVGSTPMIDEGDTKKNYTYVIALE
jgi:hypothetical protein